MSKNNYTPGKGYTLYSSKEEPKDFETESKLNIVLFDHSTIQLLVEECKPFARESEFQIHYHSLQTHITKNEFEVVVTVPLAFYNFDQEVTSGSVSMEMKDVNEISTDAQKLVEKQTKELFTSLPILKQLSALGFDINFTTSDNGSIHRHPGDFSFSSVDYDKDPNEPGVIYRQAKAKDLYQTDSVIYLPFTGTPKLVCTETRIVNVKPVEDDGGIEGRYTECPTYSFITKPEKPENLLFDILGSEEPVKSDSIFENFKTTSSMKFKLHEYPLLVEILKAFKSCDYLPDISNVVGKRISQEITRTTTYGGYYNNNTPNKNDKKEPKESHTKTSSQEQSEYYEEYMAAYYDDWNEQWGDPSDNDPYYVPSTSPSKPIEIEEIDDEPLTTKIDGEEKVYNYDYSMWLPIKTLNMTEQEVAKYIIDNT